MKRGTELLLKFKRARRDLNLSVWEFKGILQCLWDYTSENAPAGDIGKDSDEDICFGLDYHGDAEKLFEVLVDSRWVDRDDEHRLIVHAWYEHCEDSVHLKLARATKHFADGSMPKLTRLSANEKESILAKYGDSSSCAHKSARHAHKSALAGALPSPSLPSHSLSLPLDGQEQTAPDPPLVSLENSWCHDGDPVEFPLKRQGESCTIPQSKVDEWKELYKDSFDVEPDLLKARQYYRDNPSKQKTAPTYMIRALGNWLGRTQNRRLGGKPSTPTVKSNLKGLAG